MKKLTILLLSTFSLCASAQTRTKTSTSETDSTRQFVKDNGKTLHISINSNKAGKKINYDHTFAVKGMNQQQRNALVKRITDSLGVYPPPAPPAPAPPAPHRP